MVQDREERRSNPFRVGGLGLVLMVAGYVLMHHLAPAASRPVERTDAAARVLEAKAGRPAVPEARPLPNPTSGSSQTGLHLALVGRLTFYAGLALVLAAAVIWYRQAQAPEEEPEPDPENNGSVADAHRQMFP